MTTTKIYLLLSMAWYFQLNLLEMVNFDFFQINDFISGSLGQLVFALASVIFSKNQKVLDDVEVKKKNYWWMMLQIFSAGFSVFVIMSVFTDGPAMGVEIDASTMLQRHRYGVAIGFFYSYWIKPQILQGVFDGFMDIINKNRNK